MAAVSLLFPYVKLDFLLFVAINSPRGGGRRPGAGVGLRRLGGAVRGVREVVRSRGVGLETNYKSAAGQTSR